MNILQKPNFKELKQGNGGGTPVLKSIWEKFDFSLLLTQAGITKRSGVATWIIAFAYVAGLIANLKSVLSIAEHVSKDKLLQSMFNGIKVAQCTFSRFMTEKYNWQLFGLKRVEKLQQELETALSEGDIITLDDTKIAHPYGEKIPFLCWLFDSSQKINVWCMNLVATVAVLKNGMEYPLFWRIWLKKENEDEKVSKIELSKQMLEDIRKSFKGRLWVAMDRWFICKEFFQWLIGKNYDWVTKAKRNTALYRLEYERITGRERFVPVKPAQLIKDNFMKLLRTGKAGSLSAIAIPGIYMKLPYEVVNKKGKLTTKWKYTPIAAVVATRLAEDMNAPQDELVEVKEDPATYRGAYLLISNKVDSPEEALTAYVKRWKIEIFFRTAKQELALTSCHSTSENHHNAHIELLFTAETILSYAKWELNSKSVEEFTHGEMVKNFFNASYNINYVSIKGHMKIQINFDTEVIQFAILLDKFWPSELNLRWFHESNIHKLERTA